MFRLSWNLGASASWNPQGLSRSLQGLLCLYHTCCLSNHQIQHNNLLLRRPRAFCSSCLITGFHTTNDGRVVGYEVLQQCWWSFRSSGIWRSRPLGLWRWRQQSLSKVVNVIQSTSYHFLENEPSRSCAFADWTLFPFFIIYCTANISPDNNVPLWYPFSLPSFIVSVILCVPNSKYWPLCRFRMKWTFCGCVVTCSYLWGKIAVSASAPHISVLLH